MIKGLYGVWGLGFGGFPKLGVPFKGLKGGCRDRIGL